MSAQAEKKSVKLISAEGFEFLVDWDAACVSNTIKNMLSSQGAQGAGHGDRCDCDAQLVCGSLRTLVRSYTERQTGRRACQAPPSLVATAATTAAAHPLPLAAGNFIENEQGEIRFPEITTPVLEVVCKYFYYKASRQGDEATDRQPRVRPCAGSAGAACTHPLASAPVLAAPSCSCGTPTRPARTSPSFGWPQRWR